MRLLPVLAVALMVPLAGCFHAVKAAGVSAADLTAEGYTAKDPKSETRGGIAKVETRQYERTDLTSGYATLIVVTVTEIPVVTARAVGAAADGALANYNAKETDPVDIDFSKAGAGKVSAKGYTLEQNGQAGKGFRAEFSCPDGYVVVVGAGADLKVPGGTGSTMFDNVASLAKRVTCDGG